MKAKSKKPVKKVKKTKAATKKVAKKTKVAKKAAKKIVKKSVKTTKKKGSKKSVKAVKKTVITTTTTTTVTTSITPKETHYLLIVDESGSMDGVRNETLSGLNEQIQTIKNLNEKYPDQEYFVSIVKFDNEIVPLFENIAADKLNKLTLQDYAPDATTALHDAIGISVNKLKDRISTKLNSGEADAFVVILTDGFENASKEYNASKIKTLIESLESTKMWTFTFVGANQNAVVTAGSMGISSINTANFTSTGQGSTLAFQALNSSLGKRAKYRSAGVYTNTSYLSEVACNNNIGEDALSLDLSGTVSDEDIQKAKDALANSKPDNNTPTV